MTWINNTGGDMEIKDFTGVPIRIGVFPASIDVENIENYHSSDGLQCSFYPYQYKDKDEHFMQIRRCKKSRLLKIFIFKFGRQEENQNAIDNGSWEIVFDSRDIKWESI